MDKIEPKQRHCYCGLWVTNPSSLQNRNIPFGYCDICDCGEYGHLRHAPDGPYTDAFCDRCFNKLLWLNIARLGGVIIFFASLLTTQFLFSFTAVFLFGFTLYWRNYIFPNYQKKLKAKNHP